ncbi:MAG TPA: hypothetical protein VFM45_10310, partial [Anaeromyxobacteraceae bacterium]|nr:hypothetical protein [Anaeromyxobacteraceae bacterium]
YKGCLTGVPGAKVSVIGRDRQATTDTGGRFLLDLPPGRYSLLIRGPQLVPDQRVDDVVVSAGAMKDLGIVEVWADERPALCVPDAASAAATGDTEPTVAAAPDLPAVDLPGTAVTVGGSSQGQVLVRGSPGSGLGQFGLQGNPARDDEDALGPPTFAVGPNGGLLVLDVLNGRIQRFDPRGKPVGSFPVGRPGAEPVFEQDMAVSEDGSILVVTEGEGASLTQYDPSGRVILSGALPPSFKGVDQIVSVKGRPVFLMLNGQSVRAELGWGGIHAEGPRPGLPAGDVYVEAERAGRWGAIVRFAAADGRVRRTVNLRSAIPISRVRLVGVNRRGDVVLAVDRHDGNEDEATRAEILLLSLTPQGQIAGSIIVPPGDRRWLFREFALAPDGAVIQMQSDLAEVRLVRWPLPTSPKDAAAGEGLIRGRILDGPRPAAGAVVSAGKGHRAPPAGADGTFEIRLPPGTWTLSIRKAAPPGAPEPAPAEIRVNVAPGSTIEMGTVQLTAPRGAPPQGSTPPVHHEPFP